MTQSKKFFILILSITTLFSQDENPEHIEEVKNVEFDLLPSNLFSQAALSGLPHSML